ncbi:lytic polysaccharide monooxygenase auxiliary activity family 9 protein [Kitasatospora cinereorecta]|uniref:Lytic polysaccharide monooxygenase n=1 Tax=Kitasatospora cinereorecta TaxID=285560 RepID=A0ABW0VC94_9ACTN
MPVLSVRRVAAALAAVPLALVLSEGSAAAHGSMQNPLSRVEGCYLEGPEHPKSAACAAAIQAGGTQAMYDWNGVRIGDAGGRHRELIPDGRLCSAGNAEFAGLDLPRADWPATSLTAGADFTFRYRATAPHRGTFKLYLTNPSYDPAKPLTWSNLDATPFLTVTDPQLADGQYVLPGKIPAGRTGRQLVYAIWQRSDSPEAFYSCSDVVFDGSGAKPGSAPVPADTGGAQHVLDAAQAAAGATATAAASTPAAQPAAAQPAVAQPALAAADTPTTASPAGPSDTAARPVAGQLAQTGSSWANGLMLSVGSAFLLAGAAVAVITRRRGSHARRAGAR